MNRPFHTIFFILVTLYSQLNLAFADMVFQDFSTETGNCTPTVKSDLIDQEPSIGYNYSYTLDNTKIYGSRGFSRETGSIIPPLTKLNCLMRSNDKMLVTSADDAGSYCGWVEVEGLLKARHDNP